MKKVICCIVRQFAGKFLGCLLLTCLVESLVSSQAIAQVSGDPSPRRSAYAGYFDRYTETYVRYPVPKWAVVDDVRFSVPQKGSAELTIRLGAPLHLNTKDRFTLETYFDTSIPGIFDTAVIYTHGSYVYESDPPIKPGSASVIVKSKSLFTQLEPAEVTVNGDTVIIRFSSTLIENSQPSLFVARYLPGHVDI